MKSDAVELPEWMTRQEHGTALLYRLLVWLALSLGRSAMRLVLPVICVYFVVFSAPSRLASKRYLRLALQRPPTAIDVYHHFHSFASCVLDRVFFLKDQTERFEFNVYGEDIVTRLQERGTGCILLGAHMGSFEALRAIGRSSAGLRVNMVMFEENARKISCVLAAINPDLASDIIALGRPESFIEIQQRLAEGRFVGILADRSLSGERQVACDFLGKPAEFSSSPFRIMSILQVPVVFMVGLYRGGNRYDVHFEIFAEPEDIPNRATADMLDATVRRYVERVEHYCCDAPFNWFNFYDVWI